ncbi:MAG TPA: NAD(P)-dependent oxidoreductase [Marmoricola sp.]
MVLSGGTGVIGRAALPALLAAGHEVVVLSRSLPNHEFARSHGAEAVEGDLLDPDSLKRAYAGADAVVNLASQIPIGYTAVLPGAWRRSDELRTTGVAHVVAAAAEAGVRRVVQESVSYVYADAGDSWIDEDDPLEITAATEPVAVAESRVQEYSDSVRTGVVLRFGSTVGADPQTAFMLRGARNGRPVGFGRPEGWAHIIHTDDLGAAVVAALHAPSGVYNVGAEPVRRADLAEGFASSVGVDRPQFLGPILRRVAGGRIEPLTRSLRVCSERFTANTGWAPSRPHFDASWLAAAAELQSSP